ncbi:hypothetical protein RMN56_16155 [Micromonospora halotolerans]|uniref:Uncharacterized protein n=1 Tax=Micromonospora halotolerans TaxID=709879 RepID=A0ABZ0A6I3_9ACTN|nr:hypothetical protein [Micromonospora halotolerans]WNM42777.1 hypothetical protein RMN56_16155 [Micromonospora halotolerans]
MVKLAEETLAAVGRMTVAATELEHVLSRLGAGEADPDEIFARAGAPLLAARAAARSAPPAIRADYASLVEGAATQLAVGQAALRAVWRGGRSDPALFDEITARLLRCRDVLHDRILAPQGTD